MILDSDSITRLQEAAETLIAEGADPAFVVAALGTIAIKAREPDPDASAAHLESVARLLRTIALARRAARPSGRDSTH